MRGPQEVRGSRQELLLLLLLLLILHVQLLLRSPQYGVVQSRHLHRVRMLLQQLELGDCCCCCCRLLRLLLPLQPPRDGPLPLSGDSC